MKCYREVENILKGQKKENQQWTEINKPCTEEELGCSYIWSRFQGQMYQIQRESCQKLLMEQHQEI